MSKRNLGILFAITAAFTYGMNPLFALPLYHRHFCTEAVLLLRYLPATVIMGVWAWQQGEKLLIAPKKMLLVIPICSLCGFSSLFLYASYNMMDSGIASTLLFVYPLMTALIMSTFFHEKLRWQTTVAIGMSLIGVFMLSRQDGGGTVSLYGIFMVMMSALTYAVYLAIAGRGGVNSVSSMTLTFYIMLSAVVIYVAKLLICPSYSDTGTLFGTFTPQVWGCVAGLTLLPTIVSFYLVTLAVRYVGATPAAIIGALEPISAVFFGVTVFHEPFSLRLLVGIILILTGVIVTVSSKTT